MSKFNLGGLVDAVAYGSLNEILGLGRSKDGVSRPNRYEVTLLPPTGSAGTGTSKNTNIFSLTNSRLSRKTTFRLVNIWKCAQLFLLT